MHAEPGVDHRPEAPIKIEHVLVRTADDPACPERARRGEGRTGDDLRERALAVARPDPCPAQLDERRRSPRDRLDDRAAVRERALDRQRRPRPAQMDPHTPVRPALAVARQHDPRLAQLADPKADIPEMAPQAVRVTGEVQRGEVGPVVGDEHLDRNFLKLRDRTLRHGRHSSG